MKNEQKLGIPKLINGDDNEYENTYSVIVNDTSLTNISEVDLDLDCDNNPILRITVIDPEVELQLGHYKITSVQVDKCRRTFYNVEDVRTGKRIECQRLRFDGKDLTIAFGQSQLKKEYTT